MSKEIMDILEVYYTDRLKAKDNPRLLVVIDEIAIAEIERLMIIAKQELLEELNSEQDSHE